MNNLSILDYYRDTENKEVWLKEIDGTQFRLYIPKWRIPNPIPTRIVVEVLKGHTLDKTSLTKELVKLDHLLLSQPIVAHLSKNGVFSKTVQYEPDSDSKHPEIGNPYIPFSHTYDKTAELTIRVSWIMS